MRRLSHLVILAAIGSCALAGLQAQPAPAYRITQAVPLGAPDDWDMLTFDRASGTVYVTHGDRVSVVDGLTGKVRGQVIGMPGKTHGVGISTATGKGYTDDGKAGQAVAFDLRTLRVRHRIKVQEDADAVAVDPVTGHVFLANGDSGMITVIDPRADRVLATIDGAGGLEMILAGGDGKIYVNGADKREVLRIDARTNRIDARWPVPACTSPHGLAMDGVWGRLFVTCTNRILTVLDMRTGTVVGTAPIEPGTDAAAFDPRRKLIFTSSALGTITVTRETDPATFAPLGDIKSVPLGRTMTIDPDSGRLYVVAPDIDPDAPLKPGPRGLPPRPVPLRGTLKLYFLDPS